MKRDDLVRVFSEVVGDDIKELVIFLTKLKKLVEDSKGGKD